MAWFTDSEPGPIGDMAFPRRMFVAAAVPAMTSDVARGLVPRFAATGVAATWVDPGQLHLTLWFLPAVSDDELVALCAALDRVAARQAPFTVDFGGVGCFPDAHRPRVVWIGVRGGTARLLALHEALAGELVPSGFPAEERLYHPHVTLGRVRPGDRDATARLRRQIASLGEIPAGGGVIDSLTLFESRRDSAGPRSIVTHVACFNGATGA